jgi:hypothetical protein
MKRKVGLWIDHRKAVIVFLAGQEEEMKLVRSNVEKQIQRAAASRSGGPFESQAVPSDDRQQRKFTAHLNTYFSEVISCILVGVETIDEMTDHQIAAKVRQYFLNLK